MNLNVFMKVITNTNSLHKNSDLVYVLNLQYLHTSYASVSGIRICMLQLLLYKIIYIYVKYN